MRAPDDPPQGDPNGPAAVVDHRRGGRRGSAPYGKAHLPAFFEGIARTGNVTEFTPLSLAANDDGDVMVVLRFAFTVTDTGKDIAMNLHHFWRFRDGQVAFYRGSEDTAQVAAALER
jgi:ketosteroid isomerase-like protein